MGRKGRKKRVVIPRSDEDLLAQCRVETFRAGGPGGQHQNTTESAVRLTHEPTGVTMTCRQERSQHRNRKIALRRLRKKLLAMARRQRKEGRKPTRVPKREKERRLREKRHRSEIKRLRKDPPTPPEYR